MPAFGEIVKYTEFGRSYNAVVIGSRELEHHLGEDNEPLLNLVIVKPIVADQCANCGARRVQHGKPAPVSQHVCKQFQEPDPIAATNPLDYVQIVTDIPHESHAFTKEQLETIAATGVSMAQAYPGDQMPGGRWSELSQADLLVAAAEAPVPAGGGPTVH